MPASLKNSSVETGLEKISFHSNPKKGNAKECSIALISHTSKVMLKILQVRLQQYVNHEFPDIQAGLRKGRGTRERLNCQHLLDHQKSKKVPENHLLPLYWLCQSLCLCGAQKNCGKFLKRWEYQTTLLASWEICMQVKKEQLEPDMEQRTVSKLGKEYVKAVYCHPAYLTYMQS